MDDDLPSKEEHGFYYVGVKGKITYIPFNNSSEYKVYCIGRGNLLWWYKSDKDNNIKESIKEAMKESGWQI